MDQSMVSEVRRFNRVVTQRVGALRDHFLSRSRPLGEARLLWEIGDEGRDVRWLRSRLDLDSGYLSRLMRSLEAAGLLTVEPSEHDRRVRTVRLTAAGRLERAAVDQHGDEVARSLLEPLGDEQRGRLVTAMREVERLLTAALVEIGPVDPTHPDAQHCLRHYFAELDVRFDAGFDPDVGLGADLAQFRPPTGTFLVASLRSEPIGCGALRFQPDGATDLKRMWIAPSVRGLGIGRRLLGELEARAVAAGSRLVRLETNRTLTEAIAMYRAAGYREVPPFNDEPYGHHWFAKDVGSAGAAASRAG
jgi:DNA-binding MarR family transcriptional regulator